MRISLWLQEPSSEDSTDHKQTDNPNSFQSQRECVWHVNLVAEEDDFEPLDRDSENDHSSSDYTPGQASVESSCELALKANDCQTHIDLQDQALQSEVVASTNSDCNLATSRDGLFPKPDKRSRSFGDHSLRYSHGHSLTDILGPNKKEEICSTMRMSDCLEVFIFSLEGRIEYGPRLYSRYLYSCCRRVHSCQF